MGDYTRFEFNAVLRKDTPKEVLDVLAFALDGDTDCDTLPPFDLPEHPFFRTEHWLSIFWGATSIHPDTLPENGRPNPVLEEGADGLRLKVLSSFKNYDGEVKSFCDWIGPYLNVEDGTEVGSTQFEYATTEIKLVKDRGVVVFLEAGEPELYDGYGMLPG